MRIKTSTTRFVAASWLLALTTAFGQGTIAFQNLDFEQAVVPDVPAGQYGGYVPTVQGLPGWTAYDYYPDRAIDTIRHNDLTLGAPSVAIMGPFWGPVPPILQGNYTAVLQASFPDLTIKPAIAQVGTIPTDAGSLEYWLNHSYGLNVSFAGQVLSSVLIGTTSGGVSVFRADVSAFAGETGELRFFGDGYLDDIRFTSVPEPSALGLLALGGMLFANRLRKGKSA